MVGVVDSSVRISKKILIEIKFFVFVCNHAVTQRPKISRLFAQKMAFHIVPNKRLVLFIIQIEEMMNNTRTECVSVQANNE